MCLYSLHVSQSMVTRAVVGKNLTVRSVMGHRCFTTDGGSVACIKKGSTINLTVQSDMIPNSHPAHKWMGKTVQATMKVSYGQFAADTLVMPDGAEIRVAWLKIDTTARIPKKVRSDAGVPRPHRRKSHAMTMIEGAIDEALKTNVEEKPARSRPRTHVVRAHIRG